MRWVEFTGSLRIFPPLFYILLGRRLWSKSKDPLVWCDSTCFRVKFLESRVALLSTNVILSVRHIHAAAIRNKSVVLLQNVEQVCISQSNAPKIQDMHATLTISFFSGLSMGIFNHALPITSRGDCAEYDRLSKSRRSSSFLLLLASFLPSTSFLIVRSVLKRLCCFGAVVVGFLPFALLTPAPEACLVVEGEVEFGRVATSLLLTVLKGSLYTRAGEAGALKLLLSLDAGDDGGM